MIKLIGYFNAIAALISLFLLFVYYFFMFPQIVEMNQATGVNENPTYSTILVIAAAATNIFFWINNVGYFFNYKGKVVVFFSLFALILFLISLRIFVPAILYSAYAPIESF